MSFPGASPALRWIQPIRRHLPLLMSALLFAVICTFGWLASDRVYGVVEAAARDRLNRSAARLASMLGGSANRFTNEIQIVAADPAIVAAAAARQPLAAPPPALASVARGSAEIPSRALWSRDCRLIASTGAHQASAPCPRHLPWSAAKAAVGPLRARGDSVEYLVTVPVLSASGDTLGHVVGVRTLAGSGAGTVEGLIGPGASVLLGNPDASFWSDLQRPVRGPRSPPALGSPFVTRAGGAERLAAALAVPGAHWVVLVRIPYAVVIAPARTMLAEMGVAALLCLLLGTLGAWAISQRVTKPIAEIAAAATGIAAGDYSQRVPVHRGDELGELAVTFNTMAEQVESASRELREQTLQLAEQVQEAREARRDTTVVQSLLDDVLESAPVGMAVLDTRLRYVRANPAMAALNAFPVSGHLGHTPAQVDPAMGALLEPLLVQVRASGALIANRRLSADSGGSTRHWLATVFPVRDADGTVSSMGVVILDTTAHQVLEAQFLQSQKMEAVGRLAGGVAHDFNNLLTVILSYSSLAMDAPEVGSDIRRDMEEIRDAANRAAGLTRQLLAFSRNQVLQPRVMNLNDTARGMDRLLHRLIGEDVELVLRLGDDVHDILADPGQMEQVIMNLVVNARDAMPDGGVLVIETGNAPSGDVMLAVTDSGTGMSEQTRGHLFEPFFTTKPAGKGTGLGLSTVYGIVTQSGGDVRVDTRPGVGTTFTIRMPQALGGNAVDNRSSPPGGTMFGAETVLLVEDDPSLRALARRVLTDAGYTVLEALTSDAAIEIGRTYDGEIHLVLTDVVMPGASGSVVAESIRTQRPRVRVLFMSGYTDDEVVRRGVVAQSTGFLQKPFTPAQLARGVREALDLAGTR